MLDMTRQTLQDARRAVRYKNSAELEAICHLGTRKIVNGRRVPWTNAELQARYKARQRLKRALQVERAYWARRGVELDEQELADHSFLADLEKDLPDVDKP